MIEEYILCRAPPLLRGGFQKQFTLKFLETDPSTIEPEWGFQASDKPLLKLEEDSMSYIMAEHSVRPDSISNSRI